MKTNIQVTLYIFIYIYIHTHTHTHTHTHIPTVVHMFIRSSFCVQYFILAACRLSFAEVTHTA